MKSRSIAFSTAREEQNVRSSRQGRNGVLLLLGWAAVSVTVSRAGPFSLVSESEKLTAVSSRVHNGYARTTLPDGSFQPETYALLIGEYVNSVADETIDKMSFDAIAHTIAVPLARQGYVPSHDFNKIKLLIVVYWGRTAGSANSLMFKEDKAMVDAGYASLLGFDSAAEGIFTEGPGGFRSSLLKEVHYDVTSAIEVSRYYILLLAVDFQSAWKGEKTKLLWETRISLSERQHEFEKELPIMTQYSSQYFGQDSHGLIIKPIPEGRVKIGEPKLLGDLPEK